MIESLGIANYLNTLQELAEKLVAKLTRGYNLSNFPFKIDRCCLKYFTGCLKKNSYYNFCFCAINKFRSSARFLCWNIVTLSR